MLSECGSSAVRNLIAGIRLSIDEGLDYANVFLAFQVFDVSSQVPVRCLKKIFQRVEIEGLVGSEDSHDLQSHAMLEHLVEMFERILHLSYLRNISVP